MCLYSHYTQPGDWVGDSGAGSGQPLHTTSLGKISKLLLAFADQEEITTGLRLNSGNALHSGTDYTVSSFTRPQATQNTESIIDVINQIPREELSQDISINSVLEDWLVPLKESEGQKS